MTRVAALLFQSSIDLFLRPSLVIPGCNIKEARSSCSPLIEVLKLYKYVSQQQAGSRYRSCRCNRSPGSVGVPFICFEVLLTISSTGQVITETLLTTYKANFSRVLALSRNPSSPVATKLAQLGAETPDASSKEKLVSAFKGVDVLINSLGSTTLEAKNDVAEAAIEAGVAVYFPSEFGMCVAFHNLTHTSSDCCVSK